MNNTIPFNILIEQTGPRRFVARCLDLDLVATSDDCENVQVKMKRMIERLSTFAANRCRLSDVFRPAAPELWEKFWTSGKIVEMSGHADGSEGESAYFVCHGGRAA